MSLVDNITEIRQKFADISKFDNDELLAICTKKRLEELDSKYEKEFDKLMLSLTQDCVDERDFDKLAESINSLSNVLLSLYTTLVDHIKFYS